MGLAELLQQQTAERHCKFWHVQQKLSKDDQKALNDAIDSGVIGSHIARALKEYGYPMSESTVRGHINNTCACHR